MVRKAYDRELSLLNSKLNDMGTMCVDGIDYAVEALFDSSDIDSLVKNVHMIEKETDRIESDIEDMCMKLILRQQPVARDLKVITAAMRMVSDMERIGDQVADIIDIAKKIENQHIGSQTHIREMAEETKKMIINSIDSFESRDLELAKNVIENDEKVDQLFVQLKRELIKVIYQDISQGSLALDILMVSKYFERLGDHAVNIAEAVCYAYN